MSTKTGQDKVITDALDGAKALVETAQREEEQLDLLEDVTPEDMVEARERLGPHAGRLSVLRQAREVKRGRPKGSRNKRTDDFARYLGQYGQHPAITMMQIQSTAPEVLIENSRRTVMKILKGGKDRADKVVEVVEETLTYEAAQSLRIRCAEGLLPYIESKRPVAVDMNFSGLSDLIIAGVTHSDAEVQDVLDADFTSVDDEEEAA
jgi:hypothetical protein